MGGQLLSTDPKAGRLLSTDASAGRPSAAAPDFRSTNQTDPQGQPVVAGKPFTTSLKDFGREATAGLNPSTINKAIQAAFWHPIETIKGIPKAQDVPRQKAMQAFEEGHTTEGVGHLINWLVPFLGPRLDEAGDYLRQGEIAKGLGATTDVAAQVALPVAAERSAVALRGTLKPLVRSGNNPADAAAVAYGQSKGIPIDAGAATGRPFVRNIQKKLEGTLGGSAPAGASRLEQQAALSRVGDQLADQVHPRPVQPVQAGEGIRDSVAQVAQNHATTASQHYGVIEKAQAANPSRFAVDITREKAALRPLYERFAREAEIAPGSVMGDKATALKALDRLIHGPDVTNLTTLDAVVSDLRSLSGANNTALMAEARTAGQGAVSAMVKQLDGKVQAVARQTGVFDALMDGRAATAAKFEALDVADLLRAEPRGIFDQLTMRKDGGLNKLRAVQQIAPEKLPELGRAVLEDLLDEATATGGFENAKSLETRWRNLGPDTKQLLFGAQTTEIDNFFRLAAKLTENANPSGTANVLSSLNLTQLAAYVPAKALAKILFSPQGAKFLTTAVRVSVNPTKASRAFAAAQVVRAAKAAGVPLPAAADREPPP
jgi:hypothetical protein